MAKVAPAPEPVDDVAPDANGSPQDHFSLKIKVPITFVVRFWAVLNLLMPSFDAGWAYFNFAHTLIHFKMNITRDEDFFCHHGDGKDHVYLWLFQMISFSIYYIASILFLLAAFTLKGQPKLRILFVKVYRLSCFLGTPLIIPVIHFVVKVGRCSSRGHFWLYYFLTIVILLIPVVAFGIIISTKFLKWIKSKGLEQQEQQSPAEDAKANSDAVEATPSAPEAGAEQAEP